MRLWHYKMIPHLPEKQLLGQHRECAALRGNGWGRKHKTVDYVFKYSPLLLYIYHKSVMDELEKRKVNIDNTWYIPFYRGKNCKEWFHYPEKSYKYINWKDKKYDATYPEQ